MDRSFGPATRAEANRCIDALEALDTVLDRPHFRVLLMQIDALADNGHSRIENEPSAASMELPVRVVAFSELCAPALCAFLFPISVDATEKSAREMCVAQKHQRLRFPRFMSGTQI
jgi:hypothetical protein